MITRAKDAFKAVRFLTMEYHRFPLDGSFDFYDPGFDLAGHAIERINSLGFEMMHMRENSVDAGIILCRNWNWEK